MYRSYYRFGLPFPDINDSYSSFQNSRIDFTEQQLNYDAYVYPVFSDLQLNRNNHQNIDIVIYGNRLRTLELNKLSMEAITFVVGSIITVFLIMLWHLNSLFLAVCSILQIVLGFPFAYFVYRFFFQVLYFDTMSFIVIFIILGVGADDVFVFVDAWVQSKNFLEQKKTYNRESVSAITRSSVQTCIQTMS